MKVDLRDAPLGFSVIGVELPHGARRLFVMTYDDGPQPGGTDRVLDALDEFGAQATFFVLMTRARRHRGLLDQIVARGHELGLHGEDHRRLPRFASDAATGQLRDAKARLEDLSGQEIVWFRPPYGDQTSQSWQATVNADLIPVMWTVEAKDWADIPHRQRLLSAGALRAPGGIVLCHDGFPDRRDGVDAPSPPPAFDRGQLTGAILRHYRDRDLFGCSLGCAVAQGRPMLRVWLNRPAQRNGGPA